MKAAVSHDISPKSRSGEPRPLTWTQASDSGDQARKWALAGMLDVRCVNALDHSIRRHLPRPKGSLTIDLSDVTRVDSVGTALLVELWRLGQSSGFDVHLLGINSSVSAYLELYHVKEVPPPMGARVGALEGLGEVSYTTGKGLVAFVVLAADITMQAIFAVFRPWRLRGAALFEQASLMGSQALGIVGLITFLVGLTLAFQSAYQLRQFGAAIYVASLTAISMVREMGPLITAIVVAGRSGSSITSEVATMKVNEEIDAMQVMGIPFVDFVAVPKLLALVCMVPLLTLMADVLGIIGGWIVATTYLDLSSTPYIQASFHALNFKDLVTGMVKSVAFAWGIGLIGLFHGMRVQGGAQEVGRATTASVVASIFFIIVADSVFSILFYVVLP